MQVLENLYFVDVSSFDVSCAYLELAITLNT